MLRRRVVPILILVLAGGLVAGYAMGHTNPQDAAPMPNRPKLISSLQVIGPLPAVKSPAADVVTVPLSSGGADGGEFFTVTLRTLQPVGRTLLLLGDVTNHTTAAYDLATFHIRFYDIWDGLVHTATVIVADLGVGATRPFWTRLPVSVARISRYEVAVGTLMQCSNTKARREIVCRPAR